MLLRRNFLKLIGASLFLRKLPEPTKPKPYESHSARIYEFYAYSTVGYAIIDNRNILRANF